jgi:hypothetical protein
VEHGQDDPSGGPPGERPDWLPPEPPSASQPLWSPAGAGSPGQPPHGSGSGPAPPPGSGSPPPLGSGPAPPGYPPPPPAWGQPTQGPAYGQPQYGQPPYGGPPQQPYGAGSPYSQPQYGWHQAEPDNTPATAGFILSITSIGTLILFFGFLSPLNLCVSIAGIFVSRNGIRKVERGETTRSKDLAKWGFWLGIAGAVLAALALAAYIALISSGAEWLEDLENNEPR